MSTHDLLLAFNNYSKLYRRVKTIRAYYYVLKRFFEDTQIEPKQIKNINKKYILSYCMSRPEGDIYIRVIALKRVLKQFFIYLNEEHNYKLNLHIFDNFRLKEKDYKPQQVLRFEDAVNIINSVHRKIHTFSQRRNILLLLLYATTGMRKSEVVNIKLRDVDLKNGFINIWQTKNNQPRSVPIPNVLIKYIEEYLIEREVIAECDNLMITFCGKQMTESCLSSIPRSFKKLFGISFSFHSFRRGYASDLYSSGVKITNISRCLGHAKISTTLNYYIYSTDKELRKEVSNHPSYELTTLNFNTISS